VKSSRFGRERFQQVRRKDRIAVVVVKPRDNDETVLAKVISAPRCAESRLPMQVSGRFPAPSKSLKSA